MTKSSTMPAHRSPTRSAGAPRINISLYDPDSEHRRVLLELVSDGGIFNVVLAASSRPELLAGSAAMQKSVVIVGTHSGSADGINTIQELLRDHPQIPVVVLCDPEDTVSVSAAVAIGARGILFWNSTAIDVAAIIMAIETVSPLPRQHKADSRQLTARELQVLKCMSVGMSNREIAESMFLSPNTVNVFSRTLFQKLRVNNRSLAVATGLRRHLIN